MTALSASALAARRNSASRSALAIRASGVVGYRRVARRPRPVRAAAEMGEGEQGAWQVAAVTIDPGHGALSHMCDGITVHRSPARSRRPRRPAAFRASTVCLVGALACATPSAWRTIDVALLTTQTALSACQEVTGRATLRFELHPGLTFVEGTCAVPHGEVARTLVAVDRDGQVYQLGSRAGHDVLVRMHPPAPFGRDRALEYARLALAMQGAIDPAETLVLRTSAIPDSIVAAAGVPRRSLPDSSRVEAWDGGFDVTLTTMGPGEVTAVSAVIKAPSGVLRILSRMRWGVGEGE